MDRDSCYINFKRQIARSRHRDVDIIRKILGGFFVDPTATPGGVLRGTGCREFLVKETKKRRKQQQISRDRDRINERKKDCEKHPKDSSP